MGDYDNDGFPDLVVAMAIFGGQKITLYHNNQDGTFTKSNDWPVVTPTGKFGPAVFGDYDNDGFLDLYVVNTQSRNLLFHNNGDRKFTQAGSATGPIATDSGADSAGCSWPIMLNDGYLACSGHRTLLPATCITTNGDALFFCETVPLE